MECLGAPLADETWQTPLKIIISPLSSTLTVSVTLINARSPTATFVLQKKPNVAQMETGTDRVTKNINCRPPRKS